MKDKEDKKQKPSTFHYFLSEEERNKIDKPVIINYFSKNGQEESENEMPNCFERNEAYGEYLDNQLYESEFITARINYEYDKKAEQYQGWIF